MKIWTLLENTTSRPDLVAEHGLSLYIEAGPHRILFDAGMTSAFADNAEKLGVDLRTVDLAVLSHGHYDHGGGLRRFMEINDTAPIWMSRHAFGDFHNAAGRYIGLDPSLAKSDRIRLVEDTVVLGEGIRLFPCQPCEYPIEPYGLTLRQEGETRSDSFLHEQYLLIEEGDRSVLFSGCSHRGIRNIVERFRPDVLIGGFHFKQIDPVRQEQTLIRSARELLDHPTVYYTGHCTGSEQSRVLRRYMGDRLHILSTGVVITL